MGRETDAGRPAADRDPPVQVTVEQIFREQYGRAVAVLVRAFGDIDLAEEAVQEAFAAALTHWAAEGPPPSPAGWIITTARNRAVDRLRRESKREDRHREAALLHVQDEPPADLLRLIFTCCHPALSVEAQVSLTLRLLGGLTTAEIAHALLVPEPTIAQRIVRAKQKIRAAGIPYRVPADERLAERLVPVLAVLYLIFNEGYAASSGDRLTRDDLSAEAIRLGRQLHALLPAEPEVTGLLALMLLIEARRPARTGPDGELVLLRDQDRGRWDHGLIAEGHLLVRRCLEVDRPGVYQLQAAINAVHTDGPGTDWRQVLRLYDQLLHLSPTPVVALHRAVAVAEVSGPAPALDLVEALDLPAYHVFHTVRGELLARLGRTAEAREAFRRAAALAGNDVQRTYLLTRCT
jgi:RNA polymerase sigma-70 factor (ECF subfamily)